MILFLIAWVFLFPLTIINFIFARCPRGYFKSTAINIDVFANREFRAMWNRLLRKRHGYNFGEVGETISSALGKNQLNGSLTKLGKCLVWMLDKIDRNHCIKSVKY